LGQRGAAVLWSLVDKQHAPRKCLQRQEKFSEGKDKSPRQEMKLQSITNEDARLPHFSLEKQARGREFQKHSSATATGWMKLRLAIFFVMFVPLAGWPQDDDEYFPVNFLKGATLIQPQTKDPLHRIAPKSFLTAEWQMIRP
jgi:hypothetical protein